MKPKTDEEINKEAEETYKLYDKTYRKKNYTHSFYWGFHSGYEQALRSKDAEIKRLTHVLNMRDQAIAKMFVQIEELKKGLKKFPKSFDRCIQRKNCIAIDREIEKLKEELRLRDRILDDNELSNREIRKDERNRILKELEKLFDKRELLRDMSLMIEAIDKLKQKLGGD